MNEEEDSCENTKMPESWIENKLAIARKQLQLDDGISRTYRKASDTNPTPLIKYALVRDSLAYNPRTKSVMVGYIESDYTKGNPIIYLTTPSDFKANFVEIRQRTIWVDAPPAIKESVAATYIRLNTTVGDVGVTSGAVASWGSALVSEAMSGLFAPSSINNGYSIKVVTDPGLPEEDTSITDALDAFKKDK